MDKKTQGTWFDRVVLIAGFGLYGVNRAAKGVLNLPVPLLNILLRNHFNDYLGAIVFMAYVNLLLHFGKKRRRLEKLPHLLLMGLLCALFWEGLAPLVLPYSTADWLDCAAYLLGALTYWLLNGLHSRKTASPA